jgi:transposase-like protein
MEKTRKRYSAEFKAKVALDAIKETETLSQLSSKYTITSAQISEWKKQLLEGALMVFDPPKQGKERTEEQLINRLYQQIGQLNVELDWLKKKLK